MVVDHDPWWKGKTCVVCADMTSVASADKTSAVSAAKTFVVSTATTSVVSADNTSDISMESTTPTAQLRRAVGVVDEIEISDVFVIHKHYHDSKHHYQGTMMVLKAQ